ncbi:arginyltransferase [Acinetobacter apis]|uniref:Aspartate/glutamate leucyltransferase n=1 Tax=Acinetobacter apis TaxID=1229165 RepID=A0A217EC45_9GAMM|nr:arginyltransferase [Acinetobacter apis]SNQ28095.1 arginine-tRNA-protein transferase [Acinetobacter apis]
MNSYNPKSPLHELQYFITPPHDCSYLIYKPSRMVFLNPEQKIDVHTLSDLSRTGFRRSGDYVYRPECHSCRQCLSCRVPVDTFKMNSQQKKAWNRNQDLSVKVTSIDQIDSIDAYYTLYEKYINVRHQDGDMYPPSREQFEKFLLNTCTESFFLELWLDDRLMSVSTCDALDDGLSAVYTFFDPNEHRRSLGVFAILKQIEYIQSLNLDFVYLGYWVPHSPKMNYKNQYLPFELLIDGEWHQLNRHLNAEEIESLGTSLMTTFPIGWKAIIK